MKALETHLYKWWMKQVSHLSLVHCYTVTTYCVTELLNRMNEVRYQHDALIKCQKYIVLIMYSF